MNTKLGCSENLFEGNQGKHGITKKKKNDICGNVTKGNFSQTAAFFLPSSKASQILFFAFGGPQVCAGAIQFFNWPCYDFVDKKKKSACHLRKITVF